MNTEFKLGDTCYRIFRTDNLNLAVQKKAGRSWKTLQYHGSSLKSLGHGLAGLIADGCVPDPDGSLGDQVTRIIEDLEFYGQAILAALENNSE